MPLNHRVVVNEERERMSIAFEYGPSKEATIGPDAAFLEKDGRAMYPSNSCMGNLEPPSRGFSVIVRVGCWVE
ncbi:hypothetical protein ACS0TY_015335 [Phlomoides rotata]